MRIATYNVNGINGRLDVLLRWLGEAQPDIVTLQELKAPDAAFPAEAIAAAGYEAIWHGQQRWNGVAILSRCGTPVETRRGLPGDPDPKQSRYIEAAVNGVIVAGLYLPNGNPRPGPKFDYKLAWFDRLARACRRLAGEQGAGRPGGRFQRHADRARRLQTRALGRRRLVRARGARGFCRAGRAGLDRRAAQAPPRRADLHLLALLAAVVRARRGAADRPSPAQSQARQDGSSRPGSIAPRAGGTRPATTPRRGSRSRTAERRIGLSFAALPPRRAQCRRAPPRSARSALPGCCCSRPRRRRCGSPTAPWADAYHHALEARIGPAMPRHGVMSVHQWIADGADGAVLPARRARSEARMGRRAARHARRAPPADHRRRRRHGRAGAGLPRRHRRRRGAGQGLGDPRRDRHRLCHRRAGDPRPPRAARGQAVARDASRSSTTSARSSSSPSPTPPTSTVVALAGGAGGRMRRWSRWAGSGCGGCGRSSSASSCCGC